MHEEKNIKKKNKPQKLGKAVTVLLPLPRDA
jgi:hypothetical protein